MNEFDYHNHLIMIAVEDVRFIKERDRTYGGSFRESGRTCWHMVKRKIDRIINMMKRPELTPENDPTIPYSLSEDHQRKNAIFKFLKECYFSEDIFAKIKEDPSGNDSTLLAEIRDLRRYLLLTEAFLESQGVIPVMENSYKYNKDGILESLEIK